MDMYNLKQIPSETQIRKYLKQAFLAVSILTVRSVASPIQLSTKLGIDVEGVAVSSVLLLIPVLTTSNYHW
jgi:hypothetical protein